MKRASFILTLILLCSLQGYAQFWISFGWNEPHCRNCQWMEQAIRMNNRQASDYHGIIHKYGQKIEREARKHYRSWDQSARNIYKLRMERDRKLQRILSPSQFRMYVQFVRETPTRIHDYQGWFNNPHYPNYRPTDICHRYEDHYWHNQWEYSNDRWHDRYDDANWYRGKYDRPGHDNHYRPDARPKRDNEHYRPDHTDRKDKQNWNKRSDKERKTESRERTNKRRNEKDD